MDLYLWNAVYELLIILLPINTLSEIIDGYKIKKNSLEKYIYTLPPTGGARIAQSV
jgi:hypothetical protein